MRKLLCTCLLIFPGLTVQAQQPTAPDILKKVAAVYSGCRTYSDEGTASFKFAGFGPFGRREAHFRTAFVSPDRFRFDIDTGGKSEPWVVWKDGDLIRLSNRSGFFERSPSLDSALLQMAFASFGSSLTVPELLFTKSLRTSDLFSHITNPTIAGEEKIDGHPAYRIEGMMWDQPIKIWIDHAQSVILKVYRKVNIGNHGEDVTLQYKPKLNLDIPPELLLAPSGPTSIVPPVNPSPATLPLIAAPKLKSFGASLTHDLAENGNAKASARPSDDDDIVRVDTDLVVSSVLIVKPDGQIVTGLAKDDFVVKEDDKLQEVSTLSLGDSKEVPRSIVLIIDYSGSQLPYIRNSIESAKMLVDKLNPKDRMAIVTDDVKLLADFTADKELLKAQLESLKTSALAGHVGASDQFDAMMATLNELFSNEDTRPIVIFQTDGDELESLKGNPPPTPFWLPRKFSFEDILTAAEKTRVTIYPVISGVRYDGVPDAELSERARIDWQNWQNANAEFLRARNLPLPKEDPNGGSPEFLANYANRSRKHQSALVRMAKFTGAWPEFLEKPGQADEIYTRILSDIDRRYIIGYYPTNRARDGKRRKVSVEVRGHPEYSVWGQKSYVAREN